MPDDSAAMKPSTVVNRAADAIFDGGLRPFFAYRDLGVSGATAGAFGAHMIRAVPGEGPKPRWHLHEVDFQLVLVTRGWVTFEYEDIGEVTLRMGDSVLQPPRIRHREIAHADDLELLEVTAPAAFVTREVDAPGSST